MELFCFNYCLLRCCLVSIYTWHIVCMLFILIKIQVFTMLANTRFSLFLYELIFSVYLLFSRLEIRFNLRVNEDKSVISDHLGIIDTLGSSSSLSILTYSYSDELECIFAIHLFPFWLVIADDTDKRIILTRHLK